MNIQNPQMRPGIAEELTKGGQPATAIGALPSLVEQRLAREINSLPGPDTKASLIAERGMFAFETAISLGYTRDEALKFKRAAENAARVGLAPSGILRSAGRVCISKVTSTMSILLDSGAYYDPTKPSSPGNNSVGSD